MPRRAWPEVSTRRIPEQALTLPALSIAVKGVDYPNPKHGFQRRFEVRVCTPGEPIELRLEPGNLHDEYAVAIYSCRGIQIGYVPAERAPMIGGIIRNGQEIAAIFQCETSWGAAIRVAFDGEVPVLPPVREADADSDSDWWPDEEWPE